MFLRKKIICIQGRGLIQPLSYLEYKENLHFFVFGFLKFIYFRNLCIPPLLFLFANNTNNDIDIARLFF